MKRGIWISVLVLTTQEFVARRIWLGLLSLAVGCASVSEAAPQVAMYGVFERQIRNGRTYSNPFDFQVVELKTVFVAPSGKKVSFFGFHDGDGIGGQTGEVWSLRFMPDETGLWHYSYSWTDGTEGGSGSFEVKDTGLGGPLRVASDNPWYFMTARGEPFHARPYGMHHFLVWSSTHRMSTELASFKQTLSTRVIARRYNMVMWPDMGDRLQRGASSAPGGNRTDSWWLDTTDTRRFSIAAFRANEDALAFCRDNGLYAFHFAGMIDQGSQYAFEDFRVFLRYFVARLAPFCSTFGWSPTWEWMDIWKPDQVQQIMQYAHDLDPWKRLLTAHDASYSTFNGWLGFSMRQKPARDIFGPNSRRAGYQQIPDPAGSGGIGDPFIDRPIIGSEDQWESPQADKFKGWPMPRNALEAMRSSWGTLMGGVIPLYDEWSAWAPAPGGSGQGEPHVRRMFDFWYARTKYRRYRQLNELVSRREGQICSGIAGQEYVVFDQDGGEIVIDLSGPSLARSFAVLWFDPASGREQNGAQVAGGGRRTLTSPFTGDSVLLLTEAAPFLGSVWPEGQGDNAGTGPVPGATGQPMSEQSEAGGIVLGIDGARFTINGKKTFLLGASYYGALGAPDDFIARDLDDLKSLGFNWIRIFAVWDAFDNNVSAVDTAGNAREPFLSKLKAVVAMAEKRGMVVDVSLGRMPCLPDQEAHLRAVETLAKALTGYRNVYFDLANERDQHYDNVFVSYAELRALRDRVKAVDPDRLVTASGAPTDREDLSRYLAEAGLDFICPHLDRDAGTEQRTADTTGKFLRWMKELGRAVPIHYQEPFRRDYLDYRGFWQPEVETFCTDLRNARLGGAAGWCFHNGSPSPVERFPAGKQRSFDMRPSEGRLMDQLDTVERQFLLRAASCVQVERP